MADNTESKPGGGLGLALQGVNTLLLVAVLALQVLKPGGAAKPKAEGGEHAAAEAAKPEGHGAEGEDTKGAEGHGEAKGEEGHGEAKPGEGKPGGATVQIADFVVHLRDPETDRYAKMTIDLELKAEKDKEAFNAKMPAIREALITYFSDLTINDLRGSEALGRTKRDLLARIDEVVPGKRIKALILSDFVAQ
jgi:flagellar basal body-associated protein FliL